MIEIFLDSCEEVRASMKLCLCLILVKDWAISWGPDSSVSETP